MWYKIWNSIKTNYGLSTLQSIQVKEEKLEIVSKTQAVLIYKT